MGKSDLEKCGKAVTIRPSKISQKTFDAMKKDFPDAEKASEGKAFAHVVKGFAKLQRVKKKLSPEALKLLNDWEKLTVKDEK